jgi:hypothetical protein
MSRRGGKPDGDVMTPLTAGATGESREYALTMSRPSGSNATRTDREEIEKFQLRSRSGG